MQFNTHTLHHIEIFSRHWLYSFTIISPFHLISSVHVYTSKFILQFSLNSIYNLFEVSKSAQNFEWLTFLSIEIFSLIYGNFFPRIKFHGFVVEIGTFCRRVIVCIRTMHDSSLHMSLNKAYIHYKSNLYKSETTACMTVRWDPITICQMRKFELNWAESFTSRHSREGLSFNLLYRRIAIVKVFPPLKSTFLLFPQIKTHFYSFLMTSTLFSCQIDSIIAVFIKFTKLLRFIPQTTRLHVL